MTRIAQGVVKQTGSATIEARQRALAPRVGAAAQEIQRTLAAYAGASASRINGNWGDVDFRMCGFDHQLVGIALFAPLFDAWRDLMVEPMNGWNVVGPFEWSLWPRSDAELASNPATERGLLPPRDPRLCSWDENPEAFATQIELVASNLRAEVSRLGWTPLGPIVPWSPGEQPPDTAALLQPYVDILQSEIVRYMADALGIDYSVPVIGWAIAVMDLIVKILYEIFGTASGVETEPVPLAPGEQEAWQQYQAATVTCLRVLDDECRTMMLPGRSGVFSLTATDVAAQRKRATTARTVVVVGLGTGLALAVVWALLG